MKALYRSVIFVFSICAICLFLTSCGIKAPDEQDLREMVPKEVLQYSLDGVSYQSQIVDFKVVRQQTNEKQDEVECKILLQDSNLSRTVYLTLFSKYWDKGGWMLDRWEYTQNEEFEYNDNLGFDYDRLSNAVIEKGHAEITLDRSGKENSRNNTYYAIFLEEVYAEYASYGGFIPCTAELQCNRETIPVAYYWDIIVDESQVDYIWNIDGTYYVENLEGYSGSDYYYVKPTITFSDISSNFHQVTINGASEDGYFESQVEYQQYYYWTGDKDKVRQGQECKNHIYKNGNNPANIYLDLPLNTINWGVEWILRIHPDYAEITSAKYMNEHNSFVPITRE